MRIKHITATNFKRFTNLRIEEIPETARLVMLAGPNGSGKTSLLEAVYTFYRLQLAGIGGWDTLYHGKTGFGKGGGWANHVTVEFWRTPADQISRKKSVYVRTAYRNDPEFLVRALERQQPLVEQHRIQRLIENDSVVGRNYARLASQGLEDIYEREDPEMSIGEFREKTIGSIRASLKRLFPDLILDSLGNPLTSGAFKFTKGKSSGYDFRNLSGGEKSVFDLILDLIIAGREFDDTVFFIDEPEAHLNPRIHGDVVSELLNLISSDSQLWLATHSIGMMRRAREISRERPGEVVFLDFEGLDFDETQVMRPIKPTRTFWERVYSVALDDLATLIAPEIVVICEGNSAARGSRRGADFDADCYGRIFEAEYPEVRFVSGGSSTEVKGDKLALMKSIEALVKGAQVIRLIDGDDHSPDEKQAWVDEGVRVLERRSIESYLMSDEILEKLCDTLEKAELKSEVTDAKKEAIKRSIDRKNPPDDVKSASGEIHTELKRILSLTGKGSDATAFMRSTLAPLVTPETEIYKELRSEIFGAPSESIS